MSYWLSVEAWSLSHVQGILLHPFAHNGFGHFFCNASLFIPLSAILWICGVDLDTYLVVLGISTVGSGLASFFLNAPGKCAVGASGTINGLFGYRLVFGFVSWSPLALISSLVCGVLFAAGVLKGLVPRLFSGISWQAHVGGLIGGVLTGIYWA
ncbi:MAG: rhomboid family intramembrane serine protease [Actinomycetaceae bacterium]|nr:rhomboid family intramembrane serine protease [Actinomycetaceae bacterium]